MGAKAGFEYEAKRVCIEYDGMKMESLAWVANEMAAEGWELVSCSHPSGAWAVLVFSRPRRAGGHR